MSAPLPLRESFASWIRATDDHAEHHLAVLDRVDHALEQPQTFSGSDLLLLAQQLERWRYQFLAQRDAGLTAHDEAFVDALDGWARQLRRGPELAPRATRHALAGALPVTDTVAKASKWLVDGYPLQELIAEANRLTRQFFSRVAAGSAAGVVRPRMRLYVPLYLSSECVNYCTYCGFRFPEQIVRKHLNMEEIAGQTEILKSHGFRHVLLVAGDFPAHTTTEYFCEAIELLVQRGVDPVVEIAPQTFDSYVQLVAAGARGVTLYQETYDQQLYTVYHPRGPKSSFAWRLEGHDRAAEGGMQRLGLGVLLGLADPLPDLLRMMRHATYLAHRFPHCQLAFSLPRIHRAPPAFRIPHHVTDELLVRFYCLLRIAFPTAELVLSTRERAAVRNWLAEICITQMSAGSSTSPGGYQPQEEHGGEQFPVADHRSPAEVAGWLEQHGFHVCWGLE